uniref:C-type lectin domain-containing protein n=1 Tax=Romanomermis culicivorax TaxID=13658 RepID=A0A915JVK2_ROMCU
TCPYNWIFVPLNQACYFIDSANRSYFDAQIRCLSLGGAIAGMDSYSDFISLNILHKKYNFSRGLWLGYNTFLQEEVAHETKSTWFHVEYVSGQSVPSKEDCLSFSADESRSKVVIKEPCQELKPYVCIDKRNYVKSHSKIVPLIVQISQPKIRATFSQNDDDQLFTCTVEIFLPKGTLRNCSVNFDFEPPNINISIFGSCLVLPTGVYSSVNSTTCDSYQWSNLHNLPTMVSGGDINPVVYN